MREALQRGERIEVRGFGNFIAKNYGGHKGRNPKTAEIVDVPAKKLPVFKVGKQLKQIVNNFAEEIPVPLAGDSHGG